MINTGVISPRQCVEYIVINYGERRAIAQRIVDIALEHGLKAAECDHGFFEVKASRTRPGYVILTDAEFEPPDRVARAAPVRYSSVTTNSARQSRRIQMARGQRAAAAAKPARGRGRAAPEPVEEEEGKDYTAYADKEPTPTMEDFADWLIAEVYEDDLGDLDEDSFREGVRLGGTLRMEFQASDFNQSRREERRAAREAPAEPAKPAGRGRGKAAAKAPEPEPEDVEDEEEEEEGEEEEQPKPTRRGRAAAAAKPAAAKPAARRGAPAPPGKPAGRSADRPARRRGGRTASDEAPY